MSALSRLERFPRARLGFLPTPIVELKRLSTVLGGPRIFMKRDDQTGLALGGNKTRKLEFFVGDALAKGCDCLVSGGAAQSNHCRQTAAAAAASGLDCHLVLGGESPPLPGGNLLIDLLLGAVIHWGGSRRKGEDIPRVAEELRAEGKKPYIVPYGGSNALGALGFVLAAWELAVQAEGLGTSFDAIVFASSSGGTQAGLEVGSRLFGLGSKLVAIGIDKVESSPGSFLDSVRALSAETASLLDFTFDTGEVSIRGDFLGEGYGIVGEAERVAIRLAARAEGILLDPVYTGRAFAGLLSMIRTGELRQGQSVLFWHTGGSP
ncbi:MAG: D-cysteine desulfhydrase family protein, partial [Spirochaetota bacterium]